MYEIFIWAQEIMRQIDVTMIWIFLIMLNLIVCFHILLIVGAKRIIWSTSTLMQSREREMQIANMSTILIHPTLKKQQTSKFCKKNSQICVSKSTTNFSGTWQIPHNISLHGPWKVFSTKKTTRVGHNKLLKMSNRFCECKHGMRFNIDPFPTLHKPVKKPKIKSPSFTTLPRS